MTKLKQTTACVTSDQQAFIKRSEAITHQLSLDLIREFGSIQLNTTSHRTVASGIAKSLAKIGDLIAEARVAHRRALKHENQPISNSNF